MTNEQKMKNYDKELDNMYDKIIRVWHAYSRTLKRCRDLEPNLVSEGIIQGQVVAVLTEMLNQAMSITDVNISSTDIFEQGCADEAGTYDESIVGNSTEVAPFGRSVS